MNFEHTIFAQIMSHLPRYEFNKCVERYNGNYKVQSFSCFDQFLSMAFAQLTYRESLRDIEVCLRAVESKLYHIGFRGKISRNTLANANENRDWRIYCDFAKELISIAKKLYSDENIIEQIDSAIYALDSTTVDLCLSLFPWARFRKTKSAVKLHTLLDLNTSIPKVVIITPGAVQDVNILDEIILEAGAFYIMDRGYLDFERLYNLTKNSAIFVTRAKTNLQFERMYSQDVDKFTGVLCDQIIKLTGINSAKNYPDKLRRIKYYDKETGKKLIFITNNFTLPAIIIAALYKHRWKIELFFKWIKQHLRIKAFYGTSENAVKTQIWIAISIYVLIAIIKKRLKLNHSLYTILQIFSVMIFEKMPILQALEHENFKEPESVVREPLTLFD
jgi:hypothetical protein